MTKGEKGAGLSPSSMTKKEEKAPVGKADRKADRPPAAPSGARIAKGAGWPPPGA